MRFEKVDRIPVAPFGLGRLAPGSEVMAELITKTDPFIDAGVPGDAFFGSACETVTTTDRDITTIVRRTPKGELVQRNRSTPITSACIEFPVKSPADAEKFLSIDYVEPEVDVSGWMRRKLDIGEEGLVLCGTCDAVMLPALLLSPEDFCLWWADYPGLMRELVNVASRRLNRWIDRLCRAGVDAFRVVGGEYASVQLGPRGFDELVLEQDAALVRVMHSHGAAVYYHNHGPVMGFMSRFAQIGMDALDPMEAPPWGDADLGQARRICGDRVAFVGNLDDMEIVDKQPFERVAALARERLAAAGSRGFILGGTASGTYTERAARNFIGLVSVVEEFSPA